MSFHWLPVTLIALAAGAVGAVLALELRAPSVERTQATAVVEPEPDSPNRAELTSRLADLERRLESLELRPVPVVREVVSAPAPPTTVDRETAPAPAAARAAAPDPVLLDEVSVALEAIREQERVTKEAERERIRMQKLDAELELLAQRLDLGTGQVNDLRELYLEQVEFKEELGRMWDEGHDPENLGRMKEDGMARYEARLGEILTPVQREDLERYRTARRGKGEKR